MEGLDATEERAIRAEGEKVKRAGRTAFCELPGRPACKNWWKAAPAQALDDVVGCVEIKVS